MMRTELQSVISPEAVRAPRRTRSQMSSITSNSIFMDHSLSAKPNSELSHTLKHKGRTL